MNIIRDIWIWTIERYLTIWIFLLHSEEETDWAQTLFPWPKICCTLSHSWLSEKHSFVNNKLVFFKQNFHHLRSIHSAMDAHNCAMCAHNYAMLGVMLAPSCAMVAPNCATVAPNWAIVTLNHMLNRVLLNSCAHTKVKKIILNQLLTVQLLRHVYIKSNCTDTTKRHTVTSHLQRSVIQ